MTDIESIKEFLDFENPNNVYVMFAIARSKNNLELTAKGQVVLRKVVRHMDHFEHALEELRNNCKDRGLKFYIYISVNSRDVRKGYTTFKSKQVEMENHMLMGDTIFHKYLGRIDKEWYSSLMQPNSKSSKLWLMDIDVSDERMADAVISIIESCPHSPKVLLKRRSRNGWHVISEGFRPDNFNDVPDVSINKDGLLFIEDVGF